MKENMRKRTLSPSLPCIEVCPGPGLTVTVYCQSRGMFEFVTRNPFPGCSYMVDLELHMVA